MVWMREHELRFAVKRFICFLFWHRPSWSHGELWVKCECLRCGRLIASSGECYFHTGAVASERLAVGCSAWLDVIGWRGNSLSFQMLIVGLATIGIGTFVISNLLSEHRKHLFGVRLHLHQFSSALVAVWTLISFGFFLIEVLKLRFQIKILTRKFIILSQENRDLVLKHREMLRLNRGRAVLGDELLNEVERVHTSNIELNHREH